MTRSLAQSDCRNLEVLDWPEDLKQFDITY